MFKTFILKKIIFIFIIFFLCFSLLNGLESDDKMRTVAILFSATNEIEDDLFEILVEHFTIQITNSNRRYMIISRDWINKVLEQLNLKKRDIFNDKIAIEIGKLAEAELVISCAITGSRGSYNVSVRGIDVKKGNALFSIQEQTKNKNELDKIIGQLGTSLSKGDNEKDKLEKERLEKERLEKEKLEKERLEKEAEEREKIMAKFTKNERSFIDKFYRRVWGFSVDDRRLSLLKYKQFIWVGIGLAIAGGTIFLSGLISMIANLLYYEEFKNVIEIPQTYDNNGNIVNRQTETYRTTYEKTAYILGGILMPTGATIVLLSAIPFLFSYIIATIYKKETGEKLTFFDRVNLNIGFSNAECKTQNAELKIINELRFSITILL